MRVRFILVAALVLGGCDKKGTGPGERPPPQVDPPADPTHGPLPEDEPRPPRAGDDRVVVVPDGHPQFGRTEGDVFPNACNEDADCFKGGCSSEICSAEQGAISTCEALQIAGWPADAECGCVASDCRWYSPSGAALPATAPVATCDGEPCAPPRECIEYYGIAGPSGPKFHSCEIRCKPGGSCPDGLTCTTIADGPGSVCR